VRGLGVRPAKPNSGSTNAISITIRARRARLERHETPYPARSDAVKPDSMTSGSGTDRHDQLTLTGKTVLVMLM
jgi:hypothetical protein